MSSVGITINGTLTDAEGAHLVNIQGMANLSGLEVGGGPIMPPSGGPPSIWPSPGRPAHPIHIPPEIWPRPPGDRPHPEHPIAIPHPPEIQAPDLEVKVVFTPEDGWMVVLVPGGVAPAPSSAPGGRRG